MRLLTYLLQMWRFLRLPICKRCGKLAKQEEMSKLGNWCLVCRKSRFWEVTLPNGYSARRRRMMVSAIEVGVKQIERKMRALKALAKAAAVNENVALAIYLRGIRDAGMMEGVDSMLEMQADPAINTEVPPDVA